MSTTTDAPPRNEHLLAYRDDGPLAAWLGALVAGRVPPLPGAVLAGAAAAALLAVGRDGVPALLAAVAAVLLAGSPSGHPHRGRIDWLVPPLIRAIEYGYLAVVGFAQDVPAPLLYGLLAVLAYHHYDTVYRTRQHLWPRPWVFRAGFGWEGRVLVVAVAGTLDLTPPACGALAAYLGLLFGVESVSAWLGAGRGMGVLVDLENAEAGGS